MIIISSFLFYNCYNLKTIKTYDGLTQRFKLIYQIPFGETILNLEKLRKIRNLNTLVIPSSIQNVEINKFELSECLECIEGDPKWFPFLPIYQIKKIIIP